MFRLSIPGVTVLSRFPVNWILSNLKEKKKKMKNKQSLILIEPTTNKSEDFQFNSIKYSNDPIIRMLN
jgi:hypothetical protein